MTHCGDNNNCHNWKASDQFTELLGGIPADQVNACSESLIRVAGEQNKQTNKQTIRVAGE